jgi:hypothetical protein
MKKKAIVVFAVFASIIAVAGLMSYRFVEGKVRKGKPIVLNDNSSWCWFQDERAVLDGNNLLFTGVTREGKNTVTQYNLKTGKSVTREINVHPFKPDDHNAGALLIRPDKRYLTVYAQHGGEPRMRYRISSRPGDITEWGPEMSAETGAKTTYSNVFRLSENDTVYNFHRGIGNDPNYMVSADDGETWHYGGRLFSFHGRPYVRYTSDTRKRIHFITTEEHPRHYNNSIYHGYIEDGEMFASDGARVGAVSKNEKTEISPQDFTCVFDSDRETRKDVAWTQDIELDENGYPYIVFSVTKDPIKLGETKNTQEGGFDHRYHYARWDGQQWHEYEIAYAGPRLYAGENEYTGLITLHPEDPDVVYISTNVDPTSGKPLRTDGRGHREIFRGATSDKGASWRWTAITKNSDQDNIRPIVVASQDYEVVLWLTGRFTTFKDYDLKVLGLITKK